MRGKMKEQRQLSEISASVLYVILSDENNLLVNGNNLGKSLLATTNDVNGRNGKKVLNVNGNIAQDASDAVLDTLFHSGIIDITSAVEVGIPGDSVRNGVAIGVQRFSSLHEALVGKNEHTQLSAVSGSAGGITPGDDLNIENVDDSGKCATVSSLSQNISKHFEPPTFWLFRSL